jgi:predicted RND superfamily exporter protein
MAFGDANLVGIPYNPLGMAMIGGLALNSLLTLLLVPVLYTYFDDLKKVWSWGISKLFGKKPAVADVATARAGSDK